MGFNQDRSLYYLTLTRGASPQTPRTFPVLPNSNPNPLNYNRIRKRFWVCKYIFGLSVRKKVVMVPYRQCITLFCIFATGRAVYSAKKRVAKNRYGTEFEFKNWQLIYIKKLFGLKFFWVKNPWVKKMGQKILGLKKLG